MMSNTLSERERQPLGHFDEQDKDTYITRLTRCWVDCATILVKEYHLRVSPRSRYLNLPSRTHSGDRVGMGLLHGIRHRVMGALHR